MGLHTFSYRIGSYVIPTRFSINTPSSSSTSFTRSSPFPLLPLHRLLLSSLPFPMASTAPPSPPSLVPKYQAPSPPSFVPISTALPSPPSFIPISTAPPSPPSPDLPPPSPPKVRLPKPNFTSSKLGALMVTGAIAVLFFLLWVGVTLYRRHQRRRRQRSQQGGDGPDENAEGVQEPVAVQLADLSLASGSREWESQMPEEHEEIL